MKSFVACLVIFINLILVESAGPKLLFANRKDIRVINIQKGKISKSILVKDINDAASVDYYYKRQEVCWTDIEKEFIKCVSLNETNENSKDLKETKLINRGISSPDGMAIDWLTEKLYWADSATDKIEVAELYGSARKLLYWSNLDQPRAIALVPSKGIMFWSDWGEKPKIEQAGMNGDSSTRKSVIKDDILWPNGLTVDFERERIFWADGKLYSISSANFDGSNRIKVLDELKHPFAITYFDQTLYWTDWSTEAIHYCNLNSKIKCDNHNQLSVKLSPMYIHVYDPARQQDVDTPCKHNNGGCSHLCLLAPGPKNYSCSCSTGVVLKDEFTCEEGPNEMLLLARRSDLRRISLDTPDHTPVVLPVTNVQHAIAVDYDPVEHFFYWTDDEAFWIQRARLDGSDQEILIQSEGLDSDGVAIDWLARNLYWSDTENNRIEVAKIDGSSRKILLRGGLDKPRAIALFPEGGLMFWTDWGDEPKIERANLDGSERITIVNTKLVWPNGVAVDYKEDKIYWVDASTRVIEMAELDGNNRQIILGDNLPHVFGFSLLGDFLYWTDWQKRSIERVDKRNVSFREVLVDQLPDVMGLKALSMHQEMGFSPCVHNNGGCSHLCFNRPDAKYICDCPLKYELDIDEKTCVTPKAFMLYSQHETIRRVSLQTAKDIALPMPGVKQANTMDYDCEGRLYWSDDSSKAIYRSYLNGSRPEVVVQFGLAYPIGLAVDWVAQNLYWSDMKSNRIEMSKLDGSFRKVLLWNFTEPKFVVVNPYKGMLFWSETRDKSEQIVRSWLDGSFPKAIATVGRVQGLSIDYSSDRLFYLDLDSKMIKSFDFDGLNEKVVINDLQQPNGLVLYGDFLYWSDWQTQTIESANKTTGEQRSKLKKYTEYVTDLLIYESSRLEDSGGCRLSNCSHLCISNLNSFTCACATHFTLDVDGVSCLSPKNFLVYSERSTSTRLVVDSGSDCSTMVLPVPMRNVRALDYDPFHETLFWIDTKTKSVRRAKDFLESARNVDLQSIIKKDKIDPFDIAVDAGSQLLFWSCAKNNVINVTKMDGTEIGTVVGLDEENVKPRSLSLHSKLGLLFFTNMVSPPVIEKRSLSGLKRRIIVHSKLRNPSSIVVDDELIFWVDFNPTVIESADLNGKSRTNVVNLHLKNPVDLTVHGDYLYWIDDRLNSIERVHKLTGQQRSKIVTKASMLSSIVSVSSEMYKATNNHPCWQSKCSHLCVLTPPDENQKHLMTSFLLPVDATRKDTFQCECPQGMVLGNDLVTCVDKPVCKPKQFSCLSDQTCIPMEWRCDGLSECSDNSDEYSCSCDQNSFRCDNGLCIDKMLVCDGVSQCSDDSDEYECCSPGRSMCKATDTCISCDSPEQCSTPLQQCPFPITRISGGDSRSENELLIVVGSLFAVLITMAIVGVLYYCRRKPTFLDDQELQPPLKTMTPRTVNLGSNMGGFSGEEPIRLSLLPELCPQGGASSSSSSMMTHYPRETINPPPTPIAHPSPHCPVDSHHCCYPQHGIPPPLHSSYHHYKSNNRPPPPTPCSTDVYDDSDLCSSVAAAPSCYSTSGPPPYREYSTPLEYDSDPYPPPPTPTTSCPPSPSTDRSYFIQGPCPSPLSPSLSE